MGASTSLYAILGLAILMPGHIPHAISRCVLVTALAVPVNWDMERVFPFCAVTGSHLSLMIRRRFPDKSLWRYTLSGSEQRIGCNSSGPSQ